MWAVHLVVSSKMLLRQLPERHGWIVGVLLQFFLCSASMTKQRTVLRLTWETEHHDPPTVVRTSAGTTSASETSPLPGHVAELAFRHSCLSSPQSFTFGWW